MPNYATYADLEATLDQQIIAQLCSDSGEPMPGDNPIADTALSRAGGIIRAYAMVGGIYSDADLNGLATASDAMLVMLTVDLATEFLFQRRGSKVPPSIEDRVKRSYSALEALRDGKMIFGSVAANVTAGKPEVKAVPPSTLAWYSKVSNSPFFPYRRPNTSPGS